MSVGHLTRDLFPVEPGTPFPERCESIDINLCRFPSDHNDYTKPEYANAVHGSFNTVPQLVEFVATNRSIRRVEICFGGDESYPADRIRRAFQIAAEITYGFQRNPCANRLGVFLSLSDNYALEAAAFLNKCSSIITHLSPSVHILSHQSCQYVAQAISTMSSLQVLALCPSSPGLRRALLHSEEQTPANVTGPTVHRKLPGTTLGMQFQNLQSEDARTFIGRLSEHPSISTLHLCIENTQPQVLQQVAAFFKEAPASTTIRNLCLYQRYGNPFGGEFLQSLVMHNKFLHTLKLAFSDLVCDDALLEEPNPGIGDMCLRGLAAGLRHNDTLRNLDIGICDDVDISPLTQVLLERPPGRFRLEILNNSDDKAAAEASLLAFLGNSNCMISSLYLDSPNSAFAAAVLTAAQGCPALKALSMTFVEDPVRLPHIQALVSALPRLSYLLSFRMAHAEFKDPGDEGTWEEWRTRIIEAMSQNTCLEYAKLAWPKAEEDLCLHLESYCAGNKARKAAKFLSNRRLSLAAMPEILASFQRPNELYHGLRFGLTEGFIQALNGN